MRVTASSEPVATAGPTSASPATRRSARALGLVVAERYALVAFLAAVLIFFSVWSTTSAVFPTKANVDNVLGNQAVIGILSLAIIIPLVCAEFDFSVGAVAGLSQVLCAGFMSRLHWPLTASVVAVLVVGALIGLVNGLTVAVVRVNSLIVTLGVSTVILGIVEWYTDGQSIIVGISPTLTDLGAGDWFGIPRTLYFLAVFALAVSYLLGHTPFGRYLRSIGSNATAARLVGLRVDRLVLLSFVLSSTLAAVAGVLMVARNGSASPQVGTIADTLQALSAAFLGATAIRPGRFNVAGTLVAIFILAFSVNGLSLAGVANWINDLFNGAALLAAVVVSSVVARRRRVPL